MRKIILTVGYPGSGKTSFAKQFIDQGYTRLNRDETGGSLESLLSKLQKEIESTASSVILDNTYPTKESREPIIALGAKYNIPVICHWLQVEIEDAQYHCCQRMWRTCGSILDPEDIKKQNNPNIFSPAVLFAYRKKFQPPTMAEGFTQVVEVPYTFNWPSYQNKGIIFDYDGTLRKSISGKKYVVETSDIEILTNRKEVLAELQQAGIKLCGASNQSVVAKGEISFAEMEVLFDYTNILLETPIDVYFCPHSPAPINCYCRKPMPGMAVHFIEKYQLNPKMSWMVGDMTSDKTFAKRAHLNYMEAEEFFSGGYKKILKT